MALEKSYEILFPIKDPCNNIWLRSISKKDKDKIIKWINDEFIIDQTFISHGPKSNKNFFKTVYNADRYFALLLEKNTRRSFAIMYKDEHIGTVGLKEIDNISKRAECFIDIGEKSFRYRGFGPKALSLLFNFSFGDLALEYIKLDVLEFNVAAIKAYVSLGFTFSPSQVWHCDGFGQYWRVLAMILPKSKWQSINDLQCRL